MERLRCRAADAGRVLAHQRFEPWIVRTCSGTNDAVAPPLASARSSAPILLERIRAAGSSRPTASLSVSELRDAIFADLRPQLTVVLWLAILVLSLAGINVVISTIAQAAEQRRGTAIRLAVGASYTRLFGDTLYQHGITLCVATALGLALAQWLVGGVGSQMPDGWLARIPGQLSALRVDANVAVVVGCCAGGDDRVQRRFGSRDDAPNPAVVAARLRRCGRQSGARTWRSALVGLEIALCSAVVITSVTLVTQLVTLRSVPMGVDRTRTSATLGEFGLHRSRRCRVESARTTIASCRRPNPSPALSRSAAFLIHSTSDGSRSRFEMPRSSTSLRHHCARTVSDAGVLAGEWHSSGRGTLVHGQRPHERAERGGRERELGESALARAVSHWTNDQSPSAQTAHRRRRQWLASSPTLGTLHTYLPIGSCIGLSPRTRRRGCI